MDNVTIRAEDYIEEVQRFARFYKVKFRQADRDDLVSAGYERLMECVGRFDYSQGSERFLPFLRSSLRFAMLDEIRKQYHRPKKREQERKLYNEHKQELIAKLNREPTTRELADRAGFTVEHYKKRLAIVTPITFVSLDMSIGDEDSNFTINDTLEDENAVLPSKKASNLNLAEKLRFEVDKLNERDRNIFYRYYLFNDTLQAIGESYSLTRERVRQILKTSRRKIRSRLSVKKIGLD